MSQDEEAELVIGVHGMHCQGCAEKVRAALQSVKGVKEIDVSLEKERVRVLREPGSKIDEKKLRNAITKAGYLVSDAKTV